MSALRIGYLVQQFPPEVGAGPARVAEMALHWQAEGASVTVITGMPNRPEGRIHSEYRGRAFVDEEWRGIRVLRSWLYASPRHGFGRTLLNNISFMFTSAGHALRQAGELDVLIASSPPFFTHLAGAGIHRFRGTPLVLELRDLWPDYLVGMGVLKGKRSVQALYWLERSLLERASRLVVVTESFRERVIQKGISPEKLAVVPNGVDTARYHPADEPAPLPEMRREDGEFLVGYLGNFGAGQGLTTVLKAAAILAREEPKVRFVLVGDGTEKQRIVEEASKLGIDSLTIQPPIPKESTRAFYNACDVCLVPLAPFPILQETIPSKIFEVMACGRPVLASLGGEGARIVSESGCGLVAEPGDARAMADAVKEIRAMDTSTRSELGRSGREYVTRHYSRDALAERYLALLEEVAWGSEAPALIS